MGGFGSGPQQKVRRSSATKLHVPRGMPEGVKPYFRELAKRAAGHGLTQADAPMLAQLAAALWLADSALALMAEASLRKLREAAEQTDDEAEVVGAPLKGMALGMLMTDQAHGDGTELRKHPAFTIWRAAVGTADALAKQFGLTPASRARLGLEEKSDEPSLADVLFGEVVRHGD